MQYLFWAQLITLALAVAWVGITAAPVPPIISVVAAASAGLSLTLALAALFQAMVVGAISIAAPISATGVIIPVVVGITQGESPSIPQAIGLIATIVGVTFTALRPGRQSTDANNRKFALAESPLALALLAALGSGLWLWLMSVACRHSIPWPVLIVRAIMVVVPATVLARGAGFSRSPIGTKAGSTIAAAALLAFAAVMMYGLATVHGQLMIVSVLGSLYPAVTVLLAYLVLRERLGSWQQTGVVLVLMGVVLLAA
jgi:drug/metabolite transporter (DMT)-like permease